MWYFSWILGTGLALSFGVLNAIWFELLEHQQHEGADAQAQAAQVPADTHE